MNVNPENLVEYITHKKFSSYKISAINGDVLDKYFSAVKKNDPENESNGDVITHLNYFLKAAPDGYYRVELKHYGDTQAPTIRNLVVGDEKETARMQAAAPAIDPNIYIEHGRLIAEKELQKELNTLKNKEAFAKVDKEVRTIVEKYKQHVDKTRTPAQHPMWNILAMAVPVLVPIIATNPVIQNSISVGLNTPLGSQAVKAISENLEAVIAALREQGRFTDDGEEHYDEEFEAEGEEILKFDNPEILERDA